MKFTNPEELFSHYSSRYKYWQEFEIDIQHTSEITIVIPSFYEKKLMDTLHSLNNCIPIDPIPNVIVVLNHPVSASKEVKNFHQRQYETLLSQMRSGMDDNKTLDNINLSVIRAFDLTSEAEGVGAARKIGMDQALRDFCRKAENGFIICLDGDCLVDKKYLQSWQELVHQETLTGIASYQHQTDGNEELNMGIKHYELYLRMYRMGLKWCNYAYPYDTIGSCMGTRASLYAMIGGMNRRKAGEDFYFLHKCFPHGNVKEMKNGMVYPSARVSERVPFGTGRAQQEWKKNKKYETTYHNHCWATIRKFLSQLETLWKPDKNFQYPEEFRDYIPEDNFRDRIEEMLSKSNDYRTFEKHFFQWCDGFMVMKLLNHLRDNYFGKQPIVEAGNDLLNKMGYKKTGTSVDSLLQVYFDLQYKK